MRRGFLAGSLVACALLAASSAAAPPTLIGKEAPDFVLKSLDGTNLRLSEYRGQVVLVNFWARWAGDSRQEMPALDRINTTYRRAGEFAASMRVSYPILFDTGSNVGRDYFLEKMPMTILVDRAGIVRYSKAGFKLGDERAYLDQIRELLRE